MDWIKKIVFWFYNPGVRDSSGKIIDDRKRRKHSKLIAEKIKSGEIKLKGDSPRCYEIETKSKIILKRHGKVS